MKEVENGDCVLHIAVTLHKCAFYRLLHRNCEMFNPSACWSASSLSLLDRPPPTSFTYPFNQKDLERKGKLQIRPGEQETKSTQDIIINHLQEHRWGSQGIPGSPAHTEAMELAKGAGCNV